MLLTKEGGVDLGLTYQEEAEIINTMRGTVTRLLRQFEEEGILLRL